MNVPQKTLDSRGDDKLTSVGAYCSTSRMACMIRFVGGPAGGLSGLYDHDEFDHINFAFLDSRRTYQYKKTGFRTYSLDSVIGAGA